MQVINPYQFLGVPDKSSIEVCQKAYKKLALKYHPDRKGGDSEKMVLLNEIMEVLKDPQKKQQIDNPQPPPQPTYVVRWTWESSTSATSSTGGFW